MAGRLILDTGVVIAAERGQFDLRTVIGNADPAISVITAAELLVGIQRASPTHRDVMAVNVEGLLAAMSIEPFTVDVARMHAHLYAYAKRMGRQRSSTDLMIAATAGATARTLLTTDAAAEFDDLPGVTAKVVKLT